MICVFGSFVADLTARSHGLPSPGETLRATGFKLGPGGKGSNQAVAAHRAGADMRFITKVGDDEFGRLALSFYKKEGMATDGVMIDPARETGAALIMVDEITAQNSIVVSIGACGAITESDVERARRDIERADILLTQFETNFDALFNVMRIARAADVRIVLNPAPAASVPYDILALADVITPNESEASAITGIFVTGEASARKAADRLHSIGVRNVIITLGALGAYVSDGARAEIIPAIPVAAVDTTGAGDAFNGALAAALSEGADLFAAARFANAAAAISVTRAGTAPAMPFRAEIDALYSKIYGGI